MDQTLTQANFMSSVRYFLTLGISFAAGRGWISSDTATNVGLLAVALLPMLWAYWVNWSKKQLAEVQVTAAVKAGVAAANDTSTPPLVASSIETNLAKAIVSTYAPKEAI